MPWDDVADGPTGSAVSCERWTDVLRYGEVIAVGVGRGAHPLGHRAQRTTTILTLLACC